MYMADTVSDEVIQKGFFLRWFKIWSHSTPHIWVTGTLSCPTIIFISISKSAIFSSNSLVTTLLLFHISLDSNKSPGGFKKRSFILIKCEERYLQTAASSAWNSREARTWSCLLRTDWAERLNPSSGIQPWGRGVSESTNPQYLQRDDQEARTKQMVLGHETMTRTRGANWIKEGTSSLWRRENDF